MNLTTVSARAGLDLEGAQWLVLLQEKFWGEAVSALGFSPKMEDLYDRAIKGNWFSFRNMRKYGWVVVDEVDHQGIDEYMSLVLREDIPAAVSPILLVAEKRPNMRVGPRCFVPLAVNQDNRVLEIKRVAASADASQALVRVSSEEPPVPEVNSSGRPVEPDFSRYDVSLPVEEPVNRRSPVMTEAERKEFFSVVAAATSNAIVDSGYCYKALFSGAEAERVAQVLGPQPSMYRVAMCYADAIARETAVSGCDVVVVDANCAHIVKSGDLIPQEVLAKMVTLLYRNRNFTVGQESDTDSWFSYMDGIGWGSDADPSGPRNGACINSRTGFKECDACAKSVVSHRKGAMFGETGDPLQNFSRHRNAQSVVVLRPDLMQEDSVVEDWHPYGDDDLVVMPEKNAVGELYSWKTDPGVWTVQVQEQYGRPVLDVGRRSMLALPPGVKFSVSTGGTRVLTGDAPMCVLSTGESRIIFHDGVKIGDLLAVRVGDVMQMRRWLHVYAGIDPAESSVVRYWSAFQVPIAVANSGPLVRSLGERGDGVEVVDGLPYAKEQIAGSLAAGSLSALAVVGSAQGVWVTTCGSVAVEVPDRCGILILDPFVVKCDGQGVVCDLVDEYVVDEGGPSPPGGFLDEFSF